MLGDYNTAEHFWTLRSWTFSDAAQVRNLLSVPGRRKGPLDISTVLTDGDPVYDSRTLTAVLESSEGNRLEREARIDQMVNWLDGWWVNIILPDDIETGRYIRGVVSVKKVYNDTAHAQVQVTATCEPWKYEANETVVSLTAEATEQTATLTNGGRLTVVPLLVITDATDGTAAHVYLKYGVHSWALSAGSYTLPDLLLKSGGASLTYSGSGSLKFTYREGRL
jgi:hypothetical protein